MLCFLSSVQVMRISKSTFWYGLPFIGIKIQKSSWAHTSHGVAHLKRLLSRCQPWNVKFRQGSKFGVFQEGFKDREIVVPCLSAPVPASPCSTQGHFLWNLGTELSFVKHNFLKYEFCPSRNYQAFTNYKKQSFCLHCRVNCVFAHSAFSPWPFSL